MSRHVLIRWFAATYGFLYLRRDMQNNVKAKVAAVWLHGRNASEQSSLCSTLMYALTCKFTLKVEIGQQLRYMAAR